MKSKKVVVVGSLGQDGTLLKKKLVEEGHSFLGIDVDFFEQHPSNCYSSLISKKFRSEDVKDLLEKYAPDEVYYLAAFHHSSEDKISKDLTEVELMELSLEVHCKQYHLWLEGIRSTRPTTRIFYAASSLIFGTAGSGGFSEESPLKPDSSYGITKSIGMFLNRYYREQFGIFASTGILFNHESHLRETKFISRKIVHSAARIKMGHPEKLVVGNLDAQVDWGYAPDFIDAFEMVLSSGKADDYVIATGRLHTVREFVEAAFSQFDLDWKEWVTEDKKILSRQLAGRFGDIRKINEKLGWKPKTSFEEMVRLMAVAEMARHQ